MQNRPYSRLCLGLAILWLVLVTGGLWAMAKYQFTPGRPALADAYWPEGAQHQRAANTPTLVMLAHPRCPCTRASLGELALIMTRCHDRVAARVLFYKPKDAPPDWEKTDLWRTAAAIPGVALFSDVDGAEAQRFGMETSGQVLLYNQEGRLQFRGGITYSRGHAGDNAGRAAVIALVNGGSPARLETPVFGCSIRGVCPPVAINLSHEP
jgi:hypothetical protein